MAPAQHSLRVTPRQREHRELDALLREFEQAQVLKHQGEQVIFATEAARRFANGGWIEHHVYQSVSQVSGDLAIRDKAANLQVLGDSGQLNEIDVAFTARNHLITVECKTAPCANQSSASNNGSKPKPDSPTNRPSLTMHSITCVTPDR